MKAKGRLLISILLAVGFVLFLRASSSLAAVEPTGTIVIIQEADSLGTFEFDGSLGVFSLNSGETKIFSHVGIGSYQVTSNVPFGWKQAGVTCSDGSPVDAISLSENESVTCIFTNELEAIGLLNVFKYNDLNQNGDLDNGEPGLGGWDFTVFFEDEEIETKATDDTGQVAFSLPAGTYEVCETLDGNWLNTDPGDGSLCKSVSLEPSITSETIYSEDFADPVGAEWSHTSRSTSPSGATFLGQFLSLMVSLNLGDLPPHSQVTVLFDIYALNSWDGNNNLSGPDRFEFLIDDASQILTSFSNNIFSPATFPQSYPEPYPFGNYVPQTGATFTNTLGYPLFDAIYSLSYTVPHTAKTLTLDFSGIGLSGGTADEGWGIDNVEVVLMIENNPAELEFGNYLPAGSITIQKSADAQGSFNFTGNLGSFSLDTGSSTTFNNLTAGFYNVSETVPDGWQLSSATCSDGSPISNINLADGENITCTFINKKLGSITIQKSADAQGTFNFTGDLGAFSLSTGGSTTFQRVAGVYNVSETVPDGWSLESATCTDGSPVSAINLAAGENVTCTFTNEILDGSITIVKNAIPNNDVVDFAFEGPTGMFLLDDDSNGTLPSQLSFNNLNPGAYTFTELVNTASGYDLTSIDCGDASVTRQGDGVTVNLGANQNVTCRFVNKLRPTIQVVKYHDENANGIDNSEPRLSGWTISLYNANGLVESKVTDSNGQAAFTHIPEGTYTVCETLQSPWINSQPGTVNQTYGQPCYTQTVVYADSITLTFGNYQHGSVEILKVADANGSFDFSSSFGDFTLTTGGSVEFSELEPGTYNVKETEQAGWVLDTATCTDGSLVSNIQVSSGEAITCTFTNRQVSTSITIVKQADADGVFNFTGSFGEFSLTTGESRIFDELAAGLYEVNETEQAGWILDTATCSDGSPVNAIALAEGEHVTCTFTSVQQKGTITVVKQADANGTFEFSRSFGENFFLNTDESVDFTELEPATYSISELDADGWSLVNSSCDDGSSVDAIGLSAGEHITCTFENAIEIVEPTCDPKVDLAATIFHSGGNLWSSTVTNFSGDCSYTVGMAAYSKYDEVVENQIFYSSKPEASFFDGDGSTVVAPGQSITLSIEAPACAAQLDVFFDASHLYPTLHSNQAEADSVPLVLTQFDSNAYGPLGNKYGQRLLAFQHINGGQYCQNPPPVCTVGQPSFEGVSEGAELSGVVNIRVLFEGGQPNYVHFELTGPQGAIWDDHFAPFHFMGDVGDVPTGWDTSVYPPGAYTLSITAYQTPYPCVRASVNFTLIPSDLDQDQIPDGEDVCPEDANHDAVGDPCNHDEEGDGFNDFIDECPLDGDLGFGFDPDHLGCPLPDPSVQEKQS